RRDRRGRLERADTPAEAPQRGAPRRAPGAAAGRDHGSRPLHEPPAALGRARRDGGAAGLRAALGRLGPPLVEPRRARPAGAPVELGRRADPLGRDEADDLGQLLEHRLHTAPSVAPGRVDGEGGSADARRRRRAPGAARRARLAGGGDSGLGRRSARVHADRVAGAPGGPARLARARVGRDARRAARGRALGEGTVDAGARADRHRHRVRPRLPVGSRRDAAGEREDRRARRRGRGRQREPGRLEGDRPRRRAGGGSVHAGRARHARRSRPHERAAARRRPEGGARALRQRPGRDRPRRARRGGGDGRRAGGGAADGRRRVGDGPRARDAARHGALPRARRRQHRARGVDHGGGRGGGGAEPRVSQAAEPVVARGLVKRYGELVAVDGVDLTVERGDVFGYLGPNGAGKTTSLRMLLGLIRPTSGRAEIFGRDPMLAGAKALDGVAGFVEGPRFYPYLSGRRNLELLADYDEPRSRARIDEVLELVELRDRAKDRVGGYSHGMRQRLGIAAALLRKPRLLLLDEPATGLDPAGMRDMRDLIRRLARQRITVLLSSHLLGEVEELCNRVAIIRKGRIVYEGRLQDLLATAASGYTLRSPELERAKALLLAQAGIREVASVDGFLRFQADEEAVAALSIALGQARVGVTALVPETASLEELFLGLTEGRREDTEEAVA